MNRNTVTDRTMMAVKLMMLNAIDMQNHLKSRMTQITCIEDYHVVRVGGPRRSGHSTVINQLTEEYGDDIFVLTVTHDMGRNIQTRNKASVGSINNMKGVSCKMIVIDCASIITRDKLQRIYEETFPCMSSAPNPLYLLIG